MERTAKETPGGAASPTTPPWGQRLRFAGRLLGLFFIVPLAVGNLLGPPGTGWAACIGATVMLGASLSNGITAARRALPIVVVGMVIAAATTPGWAWAVLLAALSALSGIATRWQAGLATSMATLVAVSAPALGDTASLLWFAAFLLAGAVYGLAIAGAAGAPRESRAPAVEPRRAYVVAAALAAATLAAAAIAILSSWEHASWIVVAVVVLGIPTPGLTERLMVQRMIGQVLACALVGTLAAFTESTIVFLVAAAVVLVLYLTSLAASIAVQVTFLSAFFLLPLAAESAAPLLVVQRLAFNLLGLAILLVAVYVVRLFGGAVMARRGVAPVSPEAAS